MKTIIELRACFVCLWAATLPSFSRAAEGLQRLEGPKGKPVFAWSPVGQPLTRTLADLARAQGLDPEEYRSYRSLGRMALFSAESVLTPITERGKTFAVAVQEAEGSEWSGCSALQVVLLTAEGRILDKVRCGINGRNGTLKADILPKWDMDGAQVVVRFVGRVFAGERCWFPGWHDIGFRGKVWKFWDEAPPKSSPRTGRGLCRLQIAEGKWRVMFPSLELPHLRAARALDIGFGVGSERKSEGAHVMVRDPKQVRDLLSAIDIPAREQGERVPDRGLWDVTFIMPDGAEFGMAFVTPTLLCDSGRWGRIYLGSPAFYRNIRELAERAAGRPIRFLYDGAKPN